MTYPNQQSPILLSICIPTFNRQDQLAHTLDLLRWTLDTGLDIEIIVSDNASEDETERVAMEKGKMFPHFRYVRQPVNLGFEGNSISVQRLARGKFFIYFSDDDRLIPEVLLSEIDYLNKNDDIVASYAPHQVWNDVTNADHGFFYKLEEPVVFGKPQSVELFNFLVLHHVYPEHAIFRTESFLKVLIRCRSYEPPIWCFRVLEYGKVRFQPNSFYINVMQTRIKTLNDDKKGVEQILTYFDKYRGGLEIAASLAMSNVGMSGFDPENRLLVLDMINSFVMERVIASSNIAQFNGDFISAAESRKRWLLWAATDGEKKEVQDLESDTMLGAIFQSMGELFDMTVGVKHLVLCEMSHSDGLWAAFQNIAPRVPVVIRTLSTALEAVDRYDCLYFTDQDVVRQAIRASGIEAGKVVLLSELMHMFRITA